MQQTFHMLLYRAFHAQSSVLRPCLTKLGLGTGQPKILGYLSRNGAWRIIMTWTRRRCAGCWTVWKRAAS